MMNRSEFLKTLGLGAVGLVLPKNLLSKTSVKIYDNYVKGVQNFYYKLITLTSQIINGLQNFRANGVEDIYKK